MSKLIKSKAVKAAAPVLLVSHARGVKYSTMRPGTISAMLECLLAATKGKPASKADILDYCLERCDGKCAMATINMQVPCGLRLEKGIVIQTGRAADGSKGYWLEQAEFARYVDATTTGEMTMKAYAALRKAELEAELEAEAKKAAK